VALCRQRPPSSHSFFDVCRNGAGMGRAAEVYSRPKSGARFRHNERRLWASSASLRTACDSATKSVLYTKQTSVRAIQRIAAEPFAVLPSKAEPPRSAHAGG
jgi:hypothetical protein